MHGLEIEYSVVDAGAIYVFLRASAFNVAGNESADSLNANQELRNDIEQLRRDVCQQVNELNPHLSIHTGQIKMALVAGCLDERDCDEAARPVDIEGRIMNPQGVHRAYAVSGAICCCTASAIEGTIVNQLTFTDTTKPRLTIGHPEGTLEISVELERNSGELRVLESSIQRTARVIMRGTVYVPS